MRRISLSKHGKCKNYFDTKSGQRFVSGKIYTVSDDLADRLLEGTNGKDIPFFKDHGHISKAQVAKMVKEMEAKKAAEEAAKKQAEVDELDSVLLDKIEEADEVGSSESAGHAEV